MSLSLPFLFHCHCKKRRVVAQAHKNWIHTVTRYKILILPIKLMISIKISRLHSGLLILILISLGQLCLWYYQIKMHLLHSFQKSKEFCLSIVSIQSVYICIWFSIIITLFIFLFLRRRNWNNWETKFFWFLKRTKKMHL